MYASADTVPVSFVLTTPLPKHTHTHSQSVYKIDAVIKEQNGKQLFCLNMTIPL